MAEYELSGSRIKVVKSTPLNAATAWLDSPMADLAQKGLGGLLRFGSLGFGSQITLNDGSSVKPDHIGKGLRLGDKVIVYTDGSTFLKTSHS